MFGNISHAAMSFGLPCVTAQKKKRDRVRGIERKIAMR
jgi:hypothetical protein